MFYKVKLISLAAILLSLTACSYVYGDHGVIKNRDTEYLKAQTIRPLNLPPGYSAISLQENYPVPVRNYPDQAKRVNLTPPELNNPSN